jgi:hypothetical protein
MNGVRLFVGTEQSFALFGNGRLHLIQHILWAILFSRHYLVYVNWMNNEWKTDKIVNMDEKLLKWMKI